MKEDDESKRIEIEVDTDLLLTFFSMFSKFEKALKKAGFTKPGREAEPDWDRFVLQIEKQFDPNAAPEVQGAVAYMLGMPDERPTRKRAYGYPSDILMLATLIRETGHNLSRRVNFEPYSDADAEIMMACMVILEAWARCDPMLEAILNDLR